MITGISELTWQRMQLGAGRLIANLHIPEGADARTIRHMVEEAESTGNGVIGAMRSGGRFRCTPKLQHLEGNYRTPCRDSIAIDGWHVRLTGTMVEFSPENLSAAAVCARVQQRQGMTVIEPCEEQEMLQFINTLYWVGDTACGYVVIELTNALSNVAEMICDDADEGAIPFTFEAHLNGTECTEKAPCRILLLEGRENANEQ